MGCRTLAACLDLLSTSGFWPDFANKGGLEVFRAIEAIPTAETTSAPAIVIRRYDRIEFERLSK